MSVVYDSVIATTANGVPRTGEDGKLMTGLMVLSKSEAGSVNIPPQGTNVPGADVPVVQPPPRPLEHGEELGLYEYKLPANACTRVRFVPASKTAHANPLANRMRWEIFDSAVSNMYAGWRHDGNILREPDKLRSGLFGPVQLLRAED